MIKYLRIYFLLLFLTLNLTPISLISEERVPNKRTEEDIPLPPSLRESPKRELPREDNFMKEFIKMLLTLASVITILLLVSYLLKKFMNTRIQQINESSLIKILERRTMSPKSSVYILDIKGRQVAIVESHNALLLLPELPQDEYEEDNNQ